MDRIYRLSCMFLFYSMFLLSIPLYINCAEASGTILIDENGDVSPSTAPIQQYGNLYVLTDNIFDSIVVARSNIVIDGDGYAVQGAGDGEGFLLDNTNNVTIKNMTVRGFRWGVYFEATSIYDVKNNTVSGNRIENNEVGIRFFLSSGNDVHGNCISNNSNGIEIDHSDQNTVWENNITNNANGIWIDESAHNTMYWNNITDNDWSGIQLILSSWNTVLGNTIMNSSDGVGLGTSDRNDILLNHIADGSNGIVLYNSDHNTIFGNTLINNAFSGIQLTLSDGNTLYNNNFINAVQVLNDDSANDWDNGYPVAGNYWSDYAADDMFSGPYQGEAGGDGIGDQPYIVDGSDQDEYPLVHPIGSPQPPIAVFTHTPEDPFAGEEVDFDAASSYDRDGSIANYIWDFGDGNKTSVTTVALTHVYSAPGTYTANLTVTDDDGASHSTASLVTVSEDSDPPNTVSDYDDVWHGADLAVTLMSTDELSGVEETYYKINDGPVRTLASDGQPRITSEGSSNTLEYWSVDRAANEELPHKFLSGIKLDKTSPEMGTPLRFPDGDVESGEHVTVSVNVTDPVSGVESVWLSYRVNATVWVDEEMMFNLTGGVYEYSIVGQDAGTHVEYKIRAYDVAGNSRLKDNDGQYYVYAVIPELLFLPVLFLGATLVTVAVYKRAVFARKHI